MALDTKPAWVEELKQALDQPYSPDELRRLREWRARIGALNKGRTWPPGTFQRLLDLARAEDAALTDSRSRIAHAVPDASLVAKWHTATESG